MNHYRAFNIWVPLTSAQRVSGTVWWFLKPFVPDDDLLSSDNNAILYPPMKERTNPSKDGSDLLGRCFVEPKLGICCVTRMGPALSQDNAATVASLHYRCLKTQGEFYSTIEQIVQWIDDGPLLLPPQPELSEPAAAPVTYPHGLTIPHRDQPIPPSSSRINYGPQCKRSESSPITPSTTLDPDETTTATTNDLPTPLRRSQRKRKAPDFLRPKFKGKAYFTAASLTGKQRVPTEWVYVGKQRVSQPEVKIRRLLAMEQRSAEYQDTYKRLKNTIREKCNKRVGWSDLHAMATLNDMDIFSQSMPTTKLPDVYPQGPLNLNPDGTTITYKKSHQGPNAAQWAQADSDEMERLFKSGTLRPIMYNDIPQDKEATYVNPVCSEKLKDSGTLQLRTRATIGGDRIDYPYSTTAVTAELESTKILLNAMISDNAAFSTIDIEDFYLGTPLPHPEYIRIPTKFIPAKVIAFYKLQPFLHNGALFCMVLKTHYGLPQAGALSQQRLFKHLEENGYHQLFHAPALFRNKDGSIRFALVVDDFAVVWSSAQSMQHFLTTLRKLYTVKVDYLGLKYLGINIDINRKQRHVTLSMPGYIAKLMKKVRPEGVKAASTPSIYSAPNYKSTAQTATVDESPLATPTQQHEMQVVVGTLLYYARTVDPSILTAVHELGSTQARPTVKDMAKMERLLQYVSSHQHHGIRFYASCMQLQIQSDASYLSRTKARSVAGGHHYLGTPEFINGPFYCMSKIIGCIVSSAAEAELGAAFMNAQKGAQYRNTLTELGYPQEPTTLLVDNTVAEGLATNTVNAKRSKSMDVRFFWLRDRVKRAQFHMKHLAGRWNISDFFTKSLPKEKFQQFQPYIIVEVKDTPTRQRKTVRMDKKV
jgi:hypothetical protein